MGVWLVADVGPEATTRFFEFFMVPVRNKNTRIVYYRAIGEFLAWSQRCGFLVRATQGTLRPDLIEFGHLSRKPLHCFCALD